MAKINQSATMEMDYSVDTFLDNQWVRERKHRSPEEPIRKPSGSQRWKCNTDQLKKRKSEITATIKRLGLDHD